MPSVRRVELSPVLQESLVVDVRAISLQVEGAGSDGAECRVPGVSAGVRRESCSAGPGENGELGSIEATIDGHARKSGFQRTYATVPAEQSPFCCTVFVKPACAPPKSARARTENKAILEI